MAKHSKKGEVNASETIDDKNSLSFENQNEKIAGDEKPSINKEITNEEKVHLIVFKLGAEFYAIKIEQVKEVTITPSITRMPRTPEFVQGVANVRGDIIAIVDLEKRFNIRAIPVSEILNPNQTYTLVIEAKDYSIGVIVKEMPQSLNLAMSKIDRAPSFLQDTNIKDNYIEGIAKIDNKLIIVLDMFKVLSNDEIKQLTGRQN